MDEIIFNDIIDKFPNEKIINFTNQINFNYTKYKITNDTIYIYNKNNDNFSKFYKNVISSNRFKHQIKLFNLNVFCIVLINKRLNNIYFITGKNYINCLNLSLCFFDIMHFSSPFISRRFIVNFVSFIKFKQFGDISYCSFHQMPTVFILCFYTF